MNSVCPKCEGDGSLEYDTSPDEDGAIICDMCDGTGRIVAKPITDPILTPAIKQNANGIWMLEGEQLWDSDILPVCLEHIKEGDRVIDAGAWIGGHTMAYAKKVGITGHVYSFEPNPLAFDCLVRNVFNAKCGIHCFLTALGDEGRRVSFSGKIGWLDSAYIGEDQKVGEADMKMLDDYQITPNFIKIDVEGCELKVLRGAAKTIEKYRPKMVIEINRPALERQRDTREQVFDWLHEHDYTYQSIDNYMADVYNILATP